MIAKGCESCDMKIVSQTIREGGPGKSNAHKLTGEQEQFLSDSRITRKRENFSCDQDVKAIGRYC
jgi:hypothetical protein